MNAEPAACDHAPRAGRLACVALPVPALDVLTYRIPDGWHVVRGMRVVVPLGRRLVTGIVTDVREESGGAPPGLRALASVLDDEPFLPEPIVNLALWVSEYYVCAAGETLASAMPPLAWVESEPRWSLTEAGRTDGALWPGPEGRAVLDALAEGRPIDVTTLARATAPAADQTAMMSPRRRVERILAALERAGLVSRAEHLTGRADAFRTERIVEPAGAGGNEPVLTSKQREALEVVNDLRALRGAATTTAVAAQGVSAAVLGALVRKGVVRLATRRLERVTPESFGSVPGETDAAFVTHEPVELTTEQAAALETLEGCADERVFEVTLLHGVTGSGKTEVYRRLADHVRRSGRQALVLVPEIALTPAVAARFRATFGDRVAIQHSGLSDGERHDQWHRIRRGDIDVVVGTRSAVYAPLERLGLVVVDEEHDTSYKQEETPRYHGRDVAIVRAKQAAALAVLGSATPSLESYQHALSGRYRLVSLTRRVLDRPLASVRVVNMRDEIAAAGPDVVLSALLREAIGARLAEGEQAMILLNRRGYASNVFCRACGDTLQCPNCSVSLTVHRAAGRARCHYCDYGRRLPEACVTCGGSYLEYQGIGTERVESEVREVFPDARVARVDRDTVRRRGEITRVLRRFAAREIDVLVGTQMIAKGHDFPDVTLVGVVSADVGLGLADFRAAERTFQLLTQVAGRAGRGSRPGEAIIQTLFPNHYSIQLAETQDYARFFAVEQHYRQSMRYPPAVSLASVVVRGRTEEDARRDAALFADALRGNPGFKVLGPAPAPLARLRGQHRVQLFLKGKHRAAMRRALCDALRSHPQLARQLSIDVDPLTVL